MVEMKPEVKYIVVIDTESYAGNFERALCAYCTGEVGECGVGKEFAKMFHRKFKGNGPFVDKYDFSVLDQRADEHGCKRPCSIWPTPGWLNAGHGVHYRDNDPDDAARALLENNASEVNTETDYLKMYQVYKAKLEAGEQVANWTMESIQRTILELQDKIDNAKKKTKIGRYPAYLSVAIFFLEKPTQRQLRIIKRRAEKFQAIQKRSYEKRGFGSLASAIKITGFRLVKEVTRYKSIQL